MTAIATVTFSPAVELSTGVKQVADMRKLRCSPALKHVGTGAVNVARLGGYGIAVHLTGGLLDQELRPLVGAEGARSQCTGIADEMNRANWAAVTDSECIRGARDRLRLPCSTEAGLFRSFIGALSWPINYCGRRPVRTMKGTSVVLREQSKFCSRLERQLRVADSTGRCNGLLKSLSRCVEV
jgi:hypothetical protein